MCSMLPDAIQWNIAIYIFDKKLYTAFIVYYFIFFSFSLLLPNLTWRKGFGTKKNKWKYWTVCGIIPNIPFPFDHMIFLCFFLPFAVLFGIYQICGVYALSFSSACCLTDDIYCWISDTFYKLWIALKIVNNFNNRFHFSRFLLFENLCIVPNRLKFWSIVLLFFFAYVIVCIGKYIPTETAYNYVSKQS